MDHYHSIINAGSIIGSVFVLYLYRKKSGDWKKTVVIFLISLLLLEVGNLGGKLVRVLSYGEGVRIWELITQERGTHFIGRVIFTVLGFPWIYRLVYRDSKREWMEYLDLLCIFLVIQHIFNRMACLSYGCCMGRFYDGPFAFRYVGEGSGAGYSYSVYPTQLFEMICMVCLAALLLILHHRKKRLLFVFCFGFSISIFLSEFMMEGQGAICIFGLSVIQYAAVVLAGIAGIYFVAVRKGRHCPFEQ